MNPETWAVSKSDIFMKDPSGRDAENVAFGSTLSNDRHAGRTFDYLIANPPYGKDWKRDKAAVETEHERGASGRFGPGLPRISDGQTLFLLHMLAHARAAEEGGTRIAIIMNGSPLFTGDAGSGESEIRRYILENDLLEALIALPEQLFYNTGIATYVWLLSNRKAPARRGKVQLIDATGFWAPMRRSLGDKRREILPEKAADVLDLLDGYRDGEARKLSKDGEEEESVVSRVFSTAQFGYRKITVERPLRLNFQASAERIDGLGELKGFQNLAKSKKRGDAGAREEAEGRAMQEAVLAMLETLPDTLHKDREAFLEDLGKAAGKAGLKLPAPLKTAILEALSERDETAAICCGKDGSPEPDPELRDTERVPLAGGDDPAREDGVPESVRAFFEREVEPHVPDAWIDTSKRDPRDGLVGMVGYEINFNRCFYQYKPPRPLPEIEADIQAIEKDILEMLGKLPRLEQNRDYSGISILNRISKVALKGSQVFGNLQNQFPNEDPSHLADLREVWSVELSKTIDRMLEIVKDRGTTSLPERARPEAIFEFAKLVLWLEGNMVKTKTAQTPIGEIDAAAERDSMESSPTKDRIEKTATILADHVWQRFCDEWWERFPMIQQGSPKSVKPIPSRRRQSGSRRQHFSPVFSNKHWAMNGQIRVYSLGIDGTIRSKDVPARSWGRESFLYSQGLEHYFSLVEGDAGAAYKKLLKMIPSARMRRDGGLPFWLFSSFGHLGLPSGCIKTGYFSSLNCRISTCGASENGVLMMSSKTIHRPLSGGHRK